MILMILIMIMITKMKMKMKMMITVVVVVIIFIIYITFFQISAISGDICVCVHFVCDSVWLVNMILTAQYVVLL